MTNLLAPLSALLVVGGIVGFICLIAIHGIDGPVVRLRHQAYIFTLIAGGVVGAMIGWGVAVW